MDEQTRREFLKLTGASLTALAGGPFVAPFATMLGTPAYAADAAPKGRELILLTDTDTDVDAPGYFKAPHPTQGAIKIWDVASGEQSSIALPFFGHVVVQNPSNPSHIVTFERVGKPGALIDLKDRKILAMIEPAEKLFMGHALFTADGKTLVNTEISTEENHGHLVLRDPTDMKVIAKIPTYGKDPHECRTLDGGKTIIIANGGYEDTPSNISWVNLNSGKLVRQIEFTKDDAHYSHLAVSDDGWVASGGYVFSKEDTKNGFVSLISPEGRLFRIPPPEGLAPHIFHEALSMSFLKQDDLVAATMHVSNMVVLINYKKQTIVDIIKFDSPRGILPKLDAEGRNEGMLISLSRERKLLSLATRDKAPSEPNLISNHFGRGSHMVRIYV